MSVTTDPRISVLKPRPVGAEDPFTARLRIATRGEHEAIERNRRLSRLTQKDLSVEEYVDILVRLAGYFGPIETELDRWGDCFPQSLELKLRLTKTDMLRRDIAALASEFDGERSKRDGISFAGLTTRESAWGCLYVFEGATLGGQIMARSLHERFGFTAQHGTAFYNAYGRQNGARWQGFKAALNAAVADEGLEGNEIIAAARATFRSMDAWMDAE
jgi:heme oxygenase